MVESDEELAQNDPITDNEVIIGPELDSTCRKNLLKIINCYRGAFVKSITEFGCTNVLTMSISKVENSTPVRVKPYKTSPTDRRTIAIILQD